jgi:Asp-tRNA(Asn)/Glu-tRNA(Gln) amidotransferase A subunit family amidase
VRGCGGCGRYRGWYAQPIGEAPSRKTQALPLHSLLRDTYRRHFRENGVAAIIFPTTPAPAVKIGEDETIVLNGQAVPTFPTFIRNTSPGSVGGIPGISLPAGMTKAGLPVGIERPRPRGGT